MYCVRFYQLEVGSPSRPAVFQSSSLEDCVQVALNFHRSSNVPHLISVTQESDEPKIFREVLALPSTPPESESVGSPAYD